MQVVEASEKIKCSEVRIQGVSNGQQLTSVMLIVHAETLVNAYPQQAHYSESVHRHIVLMRALITLSSM